MELSDEESTTLDALLKKKSEPEPKTEGNGIGRVVNVALDLSDDAQVEKAFRLGLLERPADEDDAAADDGAEESDDAPRRGGFFKD